MKLRDKKGRFISRDVYWLQEHERIKYKLHEHLLLYGASYFHINNETNKIKLIHPMDIITNEIQG
mgnify:FL=1